jgi:hypothetical protein
MGRRHGPEWHVQQDLIEYLQVRGWLVQSMHGNLYQTGVPDLYCHHPKWGARWIDCKNPEAYSFTRAQRIKWPLWEQYGVGIWILTAATQEQYDKLFARPNWRQFWKASWRMPDLSEIDALLKTI